MKAESPFIARINLNRGSTVPARAYVFRNGINEGYSGDPVLAHNTFLDALARVPFGKFDFVLAAVWYNPAGKARTVDFMGYSGLSRNWKANPEIDPFIFREGIFVPRHEERVSDIEPGKKSFCGTTMRMLGREEDYRLRTVDIQEYFGIFPNLGDLEPGTQFYLDKN